MCKMPANIFFTDYFAVSESDLEAYGSINISLHNDLPLFVDPFLLFSSEKSEYVALHNGIIKYVVFLRDYILTNSIDSERLKRYFFFTERKQNWLGFSVRGNSGTGLGVKFAEELLKNLSNTVKNFGQETVTKTSHIEKLCLIKNGVGRDHISDLVVNLIMEYLCEYTEKFAKKHLDKSKVKKFNIQKVKFDYSRKMWIAKEYVLPFFGTDFVLLTPKDILTLEETWINKNELMENFITIARSIDNKALISQLNDYLLDQMESKGRVLKEDMQQKAVELIDEFPEIIDHYIAQKEDTKEEAIRATGVRVKSVETFFIAAVQSLAEKLAKETNFFKQPFYTFEESIARVNFLKDVIENKDGHVVFYKNGKRITAEKDLQVLYRLTWFGTDSDVNREVNNGRGPVDFAISKGKEDKTHVEFKLASNSNLKKNLQNQTKIYAKAGDPQSTITVIVCFDNFELANVRRILGEIARIDDTTIVIINASDNKPSASKATESGDDLTDSTIISSGSTE